MRKYLITGLIILLPLTVTIAVFAFIVNFLTKPFMGLAVKYLSATKLKDIGFYPFSSEQVLRYGSKVIILFVIILLILLIGAIARWFFIKSLISYGDKIIHKIPIVNKVYKTSQEIIKTLFVADKKSFKQVVLAPFPSKETYSLGLVSKRSPATCEESSKEKLISVFVPTTPNPTSGFLLMYKKDELIFLDIKTEDAIKYIVSCGVVMPKKKLEEKK